MQFTVDIPDGSQELQELSDCVSENNRVNPGGQITEQEYVTNIINGWLTNRVIDIYAHYARRQTPQVLQEKFGNAKDIKE